MAWPAKRSQRILSNTNRQIGWKSWMAIPSWCDQVWLWGSWQRFLESTRYLGSYESIHEPSQKRPEKKTWITGISPPSGINRGRPLKAITDRDSMRCFIGGSWERNSEMFEGDFWKVTGSGFPASPWPRRNRSFFWDDVNNDFWMCAQIAPTVARSGGGLQIPEIALSEKSIG